VSVLARKENKLVRKVKKRIGHRKYVGTQMNKGYMFGLGYRNVIKWWKRKMAPTDWRAGCPHYVRVGEYKCLGQELGGEGTRERKWGGMFGSEKKRGMC